MGLISLVYVSYATHKMSASDLKDILEKSRANNRTKSITGMLLYREGYFIQVLEGEKEPVTALFETIKADPRHKGVLIITQRNIEKRDFSEWSMGFKNLDDVDFSVYPEYHDFEQFSPEYFAKNPGKTLTLLKKFTDKDFF